MALFDCMQQIRILHPYEKDLEKLQKTYGDPAKVRLFVEMYPSPRFHYEAIGELAMIGDLHKLGYKDLTIFFKSWNIEESWKSGGDSVVHQIAKETEEEWLYFVKEFLFRRYSIPVKKIPITTFGSIIEKMGSKRTIELITELGGMDFTELGKLFAEDEYWPWNEISDEGKYNEKAKEEGLMSTIGLKIFDWKSKNNGTGKKSVVIRAASTRRITKAILKEIPQLKEHLDIFYTNDTISLGEKSFLRDALDRSREARKALNRTNDASNSILNHYDAEEVVETVVRDLLLHWEETGTLLRKKRTSDLSQKNLIAFNPGQVLIEFQEFKNKDSGIPISGSYEFWEWTKKNIVSLRKLVKTYQDSSSANGFMSVKDLKEEERSLYEFVIKLHREFVLNLEDSRWDEDTSEVLQKIIEFDHDRSGPGRPALRYRILSKTPKIRFHCSEMVPLFSLQE